MNTAKIILILLVLPAVLLWSSCRDKKQVGLASRVARRSMLEQFPKIPQDELLRDGKNNALYNELKDKYKQYLSALKTEVEHDKAKLVVAVMTPEVGKFATAANTFGIPYIVETCTNLGVDCVDYTPDISEWLEADLKHAPVEGNFTREGTTFMAGQLTGIIEKYNGYFSPVHQPGPRPEMFGDLNSKDEVMDGEKNIPYHLTINSQGLRMNHSLSFPKTKQTILFLGDGRIFNPYVDNDYIITELLQQKYPDEEIVNAGYQNYTMEDYYTLYMEKARFAEPDVVVVCTNGGDILDNYFSQRNKYSRTGRSYAPSPLERKFYQSLK